MIITVTGAYRNIGDHLIGHRAHRLLSKFVDEDIINLDRKNIKTRHLDLLKRARAIILCGGPAYQEQIYPKIYDLAYEDIDTPIIPFGLGGKMSLSQTTDEFSFSEESVNFIKKIHARIETSSVRDNLTKQTLSLIGVKNVMMTGCPVWYDLDYLNKDFVFDKKITQIILSIPANYNPGLKDVFKYIQQEFPKIEKIAAFHHGLYQSHTQIEQIKNLKNLYMAYLAKRFDFKLHSFSTSLKTLALYDRPGSLHIGYRVHGHLYCLSHRQPSFLINEDSRGAGQAISTGLPGLNYSDPLLIEKLDDQINNYFQNQGYPIAKAVNTTTQNFEVMKSFLAMINRL